ncbi:hypothetical protein BGZ92_010012 [Podila epicladia]|nr:hypothetical protein BGZ92_010012 [Podila epicladia]
MNTTEEPAPIIGSAFNAGDIAWTLASTALVWLMIPGIGYFYSGMARSKNALSLIMLSCCSVAVVSFQVGNPLNFSRNEQTLIVRYSIMH